MIDSYALYNIRDICMCNHNVMVRIHLYRRYPVGFYLNTCTIYDLIIAHGIKLPFTYQVIAYKSADIFFTRCQQSAQCKRKYY